MEVLIPGVEERYDPWFWLWVTINYRSGIVDITGTKEICSVPVSHSKVLLFPVVDWEWKYGVYLSTKYVRNGLTRWKHLQPEKYMLGCILASGWLLVWLRPSNSWHTVMDWNRHVEKLELN